MHGGVKVDQHVVVEPPYHTPDYASFDPGNHQLHGPSGMHKSHADIFWIESDLQSRDLDCPPQGIGYFSAAHCGPPAIVVDDGERHVATGFVM